jgi:hypothetical protein
METNQPQTAQQINSPQTGEYSFSKISKIAFQTPGKARMELKKVSAEIDRLTFALQRVVNLLEHADPMMALKIARDALHLNSSEQPNG